MERPREGAADLRGQLWLPARGFLFHENANPKSVDLFMGFPRESGNILKN